MLVTGHITATRTITIEPAPPAVFATAPNLTITCAAGAPLLLQLLSYTNDDTGVCEISGSVTLVLLQVLILPAVVLIETWTFTDACNRTILLQEQSL